MQKREKKSKNEQKTTRFLASLLWSRAFIYLHVVLQLGGGGGQGMPIIQAMLSSLSNCQLLSSVVNCYLFNEMQCFSFRTWSARSDWNDSTHWFDLIWFDWLIDWLIDWIYWIVTHWLFDWNYDSLNGCLIGVRLWSWKNVRLMSCCMPAQSPLSSSGPLPLVLMTKRVPLGLWTCQLVGEPSQVMGNF